MIKVSVEGVNPYYKNCCKLEEEKSNKEIEEEWDLKELIISGEIENMEINLHQRSLEFFLYFFKINLKKEESESESSEERGEHIESGLGLGEESESRSVRDKDRERTKQRSRQKKNNALSKGQKKRRGVERSFVQKVKINQFQIVFSYYSDHLNLPQLLQRNPLQFLNIMNIRHLQLHFQPFHATGYDSVNELFRYLLDFYLNDIKNNQKFNCVQGNLFYYFLLLISL
jgi:hypothetical protein